jgi:PAS domain S-box-containing protein
MAMPDQHHEMDERFHLLIENVKDHGIFMMDAEGRIVSWNIGAARLFGYEEAEIISKPFSNLFPPDEQGAAEEELTRAKRDGRATDDRWHVRKGGTRFWCSGVTTALWDKESHLRGFAKVLRDLTCEKEMQEALEDAHAYAESIMATQREPFLVLDKSLRVKTANPSFYRIFHVTNEETENRLVYELGNGQWNIPPLRELLERVLSNDQPFYDYEVEDDFPMVGHRIMLLNARRLQQQNGRPDLMLLAIEDVTERLLAEKEVRVSEVRYRRLFESAHDGILILDADTGKVADANPYMTTLLGYTKDELLGRELWKIGLFSDIAASQAAFKELQQKGYIRYEHLPLETERGKKADVEFVSNVYPVEGKRVIQCNIRDITARKKMEQELQRQAEALADAYRRKDEFLAMLSHELRNPLAPLLNAVHLLRLQKDENLIQQQAISMIERQVTNLKRLVDDLLEVSRIITGRIQMHIDQVDVRGVVEQSVESARPIIGTRKHHLSVSLPENAIWLRADPTRLEQVFVNLLNNAAKYTPVGGKIWLSVEQEGKDVVLRVRDNGDGITSDILPRIFDLFTQADRSLAHSQGGLGIGLTLVKRLIEMHRGTVEAHSAGSGQGSEFIVRLPVAPPPQQHSEPLATPKTTTLTQSLRVLVVDDNVDAADSLAMLLRMSGHVVRVAYSGRTALEAAMDAHPNIVLLDIGLPQMDGYEVARRLRQQAQLKDIRLVAMTGYGLDTDRQRSQEAGFDAHMVKPVELQKLEELLTTLTPPKK